MEEWKSVAIEAPETLRERELAAQLEVEQAERQDLESTIAATQAALSVNATEDQMAADFLKEMEAKIGYLS